MQMRKLAYSAAAVLLLLLIAGCATTEDQTQSAGNCTGSWCWPITSGDLLQMITGAQCSDDLSRNNPNRVP